MYLARESNYTDDFCHGTHETIVVAALATTSAEEQEPVITATPLLCPKRLKRNQDFESRSVVFEKFSNIFHSFPLAHSSMIDTASNFHLNDVPCISRIAQRIARNSFSNALFPLRRIEGSTRGGEMLPRLFFSLSRGWILHIPDFPRDYPKNSFFLRVITPSLPGATLMRSQFHSGKILKP